MRKLLYILGQLTDLDIVWIIENGERRTIPTGTTIVQQGVPIDALYFVLDGRFGVTTEEDGGRVIAELGSGELVGELSFVDASPTAATVAALDDSHVLALDRAATEARLKADPEFAARFYRAIAIFLATKLRAAVRHLGYGEGPATQDSDDEDELDMGVLDTLHLAGARFKRILDEAATKAS